MLVPLVIHVIDKLFQRPANPPPPPPEVHHISKEQMIENARREYGMDVVNDYNFGVSGPSGPQTHLSSGPSPPLPTR